MDNYKDIEAYLKESMSEKRFYHSVCVAKQAEKLAISRGVDPKKARLAGLVHDICKEMSIKDQLKYIKSHDILLDDTILDNPNVLHGIVGSQYIKEHLSITDKDVCGAVYYHTTGKANMSSLEEIVYVADYTSVDRKYKDLIKVKDLIIIDWNSCILEGFLIGIKSSIKSRRMIVKDTAKGYNFYTNITNERGQY